MINTNTYIKETIPYFYIIQHKTSKIMYAGSRWIVGCHPDEFMQHKGYSTSSPMLLIYYRNITQLARSRHLSGFAVYKDANFSIVLNDSSFKLSRLSVRYFIKICCEKFSNRICLSNNF